MNQLANKFLWLACLCGIGIAAIAAYYPGVPGGFYFDDKPNILEPESLRWAEISIENLHRTLSEVVMPSRPVANVSFALNYRLSGFDASAFRWTNICIHLLVGLSLFWVIRLFQQRHTDHQDSKWIAALAVLLFLVHPLNAQAVTYVVQRMASAATLFVLLGLGCYLKARFHQATRGRMAWISLAFLSFLVSIGNKEIGYLLIPLLLLYEVSYHRATWREWLRFDGDVSTRRITAVAGVCVAMGLAWLAWHLLSGHLSWLEKLPGRDFSGYERVLTQLRVQFFYLSLLIWPAPSRLSLDHDFLVSRSLLDPASTLVALIAWSLILIWTIRNLSSRPNVAFPLLAYLLLHAMESAPISLELVFEHRMYLPMTMLGLFIALNLNALPLMLRRGSYGAIIMLAILLASATHQRNQVWGDPVAFYRDTAAKSPNKFRPQYNLGTNLGPKGMLREAKAALEKALHLKPEHSEAHNQLANVLMMEMRPDLAEPHYRLAIEHNPENAEALFNLASLLSDQQRYDEQRQVLRQFIVHAPPYLEQQRQWAIHYLERSQP